ncbi:tryptophan-rich sensory protein [Patescibacteria group bacterium]|nr:tryptophan-rich sensory protein [Patescibacteria group bacterium]
MSKPASLLLIPYFLWVSFATILNYSLLILN